MKRRFAEAVVSLLCTILVGGASTAAAARLHVSAVSGEDSPTCGGRLEPCRTLQRAVDRAAPGDTLRLEEGTWHENVTIDKDLAIAGSGSDATFVDGRAAGPVFEIWPGNTVRLVRLGIINGDSPNGAGVRNEGSLTLVKCVVSGNVTGAPLADHPGGAVFSLGGYVTLSDTVVRDNAYRGSMSPGGGAGILIVEGGRLTLVDSAVRDNFGPGAREGGGLRLSGARATLINSTVNGNGGVEFGGGLYADRSTVELLNSTVSGNAAGYSGGGVFFYAGSLTLDSSTVSNNRAGHSGGGLVTCPFAACLVTAELTNTIVAGNAAPTAPDCEGELISRGYNLLGCLDGSSLLGAATGDLLGVEPLLAPLKDGAHRLLPGSPAIDAGDPGSCRPLADQHGASRHSDGDCDGVVRCDIGAVELAGCGPEERPVVFQSDRAEDLVRVTNTVGAAAFEDAVHAPADPPILFYQVEDLGDQPAQIRLVKGGLGVVVSF